MTTHDRSSVGAIRLPLERAASGALDSVVFTGAITGHDPETGRLARSTRDVSSEVATVKFGQMFLDVPGDRALAQAWQAFENLSGILADADSGIDRLCRLRVFVRDLLDVPLIERAMDAFIDAGAVATTIVQIGGIGGDPDVDVIIEGVGLLRDAPAAEVLRSAELDALTGRYPAAVRAGQFVFVSAITGIDPESGRPARTVDALGDLAGDFDLSPYRTEQQRAILVQTFLTYKHVQAALALAGGTLRDIVKVNGWLDFPMRDFDPIRPARLHYFQELEDRVASASLWVGPNPVESALLSYDAVAVVDDPHGRSKHVRTAASQIVPYYVGAAGGGGAVFTCGEVPIDEDVPEAVTRPEQLDGDLRLLRFGRLDRSTDIDARVAFTYEKLAAYLHEYGASLADVVYQMVYLGDLRDYPSLESVARSYYGGSLPATTTVPILETSPFFQDAGLEIELIARVDAGI